MQSIALRRTGLGALLALIFMGVGLAEARPYERANPTPWNNIEWLTSKATVYTTVGKAWAIGNLDGSIVTTGDYVAWGSGAGTAAVGDTTLFTEESEARVVATRTIVTTTLTNDTLQWVASLTAAAGKTITNAGNFTASTAGTMIVKGDFTGIVLATADIIQFTIKLQQT